MATMNSYAKKKLAARKPGAPGQLTAANFGELAFSYLKRRQNAGKAEIKPVLNADKVDSLTERAERGCDG